MNDTAIKSLIFKSPQYQWHSQSCLFKKFPVRSPIPSSRLTYVQMWNNLYAYLKGFLGCARRYVLYCFCNNVLWLRTHQASKSRYSSWSHNFNLRYYSYYDYMNESWWLRAMWIVGRRKMCWIYNKKSGTWVCVVLNPLRHPVGNSGAKVFITDLLLWQNFIATEYYRILLWQVHVIMRGN